MTEEEKKDPPEDSQDTEEDEEQASSLVNTANVAAERLEKANAEMTKNLDRQERLYAEARLAGKSEAGAPSVTAEEKEIAEAKKMFEGTGIDPFAGAGKDALNKKEM